MPLSGIEIYKFLPKSNCKKCGFPTCLAFAMKVSQKGVEISVCPDISPQSRQALEAAGRPPIRLVTVGAGDKKFEVGNEVVMFRHEKTFFHPTALLVRIKDTTPADKAVQLVSEVSSYVVERVGLHLALNGFAIDNQSGDANTFSNLVQTVKAKTNLPLVLMSSKPEAMAAALAKVAADKPLIYAANSENADQMAALAKQYQTSLAIHSTDGLDQLAQLSEKVNKAGIEDIVLSPGAKDFSSAMNTFTQLRRLALKKNFKPLGYPIITFPGESAASPEEEALLAAEGIAKYASIVVLDNFSPGMVYPLLALRLNIYTDPQKPIQVQPGVYPLGAVKETSPLCVTTNFSLTYFSIAGELEASGYPSWLLVCDTEGLSVLTSWAAGKFDADKIAKTVKQFNIANNIKHRNIIIPGKVAVLRGELEEVLPEWKIMVGPMEAMDVGGFLKQHWTN